MRTHRTTTPAAKISCHMLILFAFLFCSFRSATFRFFFEIQLRLTIVHISTLNPRNTQKMASLTGMELDKDRFLELLEKLIGETKDHLVNLPPEQVQTIVYCYLIGIYVFLKM